MTVHHNFAGVLLGLGIGLILLGEAGRRHHVERMQEYQQRLRNADDQQEISQHVRAQHNDPSLSFSMWLMEGEIIGWFLAVVGAFLWIDAVGIV